MVVTRIHPLAKKNDYKLWCSVLLSVRFCLKRKRKHTRANVKMMEFRLKCNLFSFRLWERIPKSIEIHVNGGSVHLLAYCNNDAAIVALPLWICFESDISHQIAWNGKLSACACLPTFFLVFSSFFFWDKKEKKSKLKLKTWVNDWESEREREKWWQTDRQTQQTAQLRKGRIKCAACVFLKFCSSTNHFGGLLACLIPYLKDIKWQKCVCVCVLCLALCTVEYIE